MKFHCENAVNEQMTQNSDANLTSWIKLNQFKSLVGLSKTRQINSSHVIKLSNQSASAKMVSLPYGNVYQIIELVKFISPVLTG